jgi:hypothetical protein
MCGRRLGKNFLTLLQHRSGAVMCPACLCGGEAANHNALRGSGPNRKRFWGWHLADIRLSRRLRAFGSKADSSRMRSDVRL